jgi:hypothetical protein
MTWEEAVDEEILNRMTTEPLSAIALDIDQSRWAAAVEAGLSMLPSPKHN